MQYLQFVLNQKAGTLYDVHLVGATRYDGVYSPNTGWYTNSSATVWFVIARPAAKINTT